MDLNTRKELFSYAYVCAVASVAGFSVELKPRAMDNVGIDLTIEMPGEAGSTLSPRCDAQVKCTSSQEMFKQDVIKYPLPVKNYDRLRHDKPYIPIILIVVCVPDRIENWLDISENETVMKRCGYWRSLKGEPSTPNTKTITIDLPRENLLTPHSLSVIMEKIANSEKL
jgi:Domain of unknown function (DUF4365)